LPKNKTAVYEYRFIYILQLKWFPTRSPKDEWKKNGEEE
jgi:hypothetical protein